MGKGKDKMWEYCEKDDDNRSIKCVFCKKYIAGVTKLKFHLAKMKGDDIEPCDCVTDDAMNKALHCISKLRKKRAMRDDCSLPPPKKNNQLARGAAVRKPNSVGSMDKPTDGDNTLTEYEAPAIAKALKLENGFFCAVMHPSYEANMPIPAWFSKKYFPESFEHVKLSYLGKTWPVGCCIAQNQYRLSRGWSVCRRGMELKVGSFCVFEISKEMSKAGEIVLKVHIIPERKSIYETGTSSSDDEEDDDDIQIFSKDEFLTDSKTRVTASIDNTKMLDALYNKIASHYDRLEGDLPTSLQFTASGVQKDMLQMILKMIQTKSSDLSDEILTEWEISVQMAAALNLNVGWLAAILEKMRLSTSVNVKLQEEKVESLMKNVDSLKEELKMAEKNLEIASSDLIKMKGSEVSSFFDFDCTTFTRLPNNDVSLRDV